LGDIVKLQKKVVITGGAGFIGASLANSLSKDFHVLALDNLAAGNWDRLNANVEKKVLDIFNASPKELNNSLEGAEFLCHLAAVKLHNTNNSSEEIIRTNIIGTKNLLEAAGQSGIKRVLFTSSLYAYGSLGPRIMREIDIPAPSTVYGSSKLIGEQMMLAASSKYGLSVVSARLFFVYGPGQFAEGGYKSVIVKNCERLLSGKPAIICGSGSQALDYVYIADCIDALSSLLFSEFTGTYNISSGGSISVNNLVKTIGKFSKYFKVEYRTADWTEGSIRFGDNLKIRTDLGWTPNTQILEGLKKTWDYYSMQSFS
jgi:UDP-glucose 4-epimerase